MRRLALLVSCLGLIAVLAAPASPASQQEVQQAIDDGLAYLAGSASTNATEAWWSLANDGTLAATASAALAFIEKGHYPGSGTTHETIATMAITYVLNRAALSTAFVAEGHGYAEDYNNNGIADDGGNNQAIYFDPAFMKRDVYTTGIVTPVIHALGNAVGKDTVIGMGSAVVSGLTYSQLMQDVVDWFSFGQNNPSTGVHRGGWRYTDNYGNSDNSTAQWGALPLLYANDWGLGVPKYVFDELALWTNYIQNANGGSGYDHPASLVNVAKTGGLLLEFAALGYPLGHPDVQAALNYINANWNAGPSGTWDGNILHPYAMWAVYKALATYGYLVDFGAGPGEDFPIGMTFSSNPTMVPGGYPIGQDWWDGMMGNPPAEFSLAGDWYSHYVDAIVNNQNANGSWNGYSYWTGALADGWYINILNATGAPPPTNGDGFIPEPGTMALFGLGLLGAGLLARRRRQR